LLDANICEIDKNYDELDKIEDTSRFGSYFELVKINKFKYKNPRG